MPRAALTQDEITAFRSRAVQVATRLFAEQGYEGVTLRAIAADLGVSPMTPYRYFDGKDDIVESVRWRAYERFAEISEAAVQGVTDPRERLLALGRGIVGWAQAEPHAYRHMFELNQPGGAPPIGSVEDAGRAWAVMRSAVADASAAGVLAGDADTVAHLLWAGVHGLVTLHLAHKLVIGRTLDDLLDPMLDGLLRGLAPREEPINEQ